VIARSPLMLIVRDMLSGPALWLSIAGTF